MALGPAGTVVVAASMTNTALGNLIALAEYASNS
jgi:hypothetical protein